MGYDVHITKAEHWAYSEKNPITAKEIARVADLLHTYREWLPLHWKPHYFRI